jgi:hypothetical protein
MLDPELQHYLSGINQHLVDIEKNQKQGIWRHFFKGMFSAFGYIVGLFLFVFILGFILNKLGILPAWREQVKTFQSLIDKAQSVLDAGENMQGMNQSGIKAGEYVLPDGRKVKIQEVQ